MQNIAITLFESMVIRNYLFSDNCELLSKLASQNKVILISNYKNLKFIEECIETIDKKNISLFVYKSQNIAFLPKICLSILKWTNSSDTILRDIKIEKKNRVLKFIANRVFSRFPLKDSILRLLILKLFRQNKFHLNISSHYEKISLPKFDVVFITSFFSVLQAAIIHVVWSAKQYQLHLFKICPRECVKITIKKMCFFINKIFNYQ
jgi:hypothetical protein